MVLDAAWNIVSSNRAAQTFIRCCIDAETVADVASSGALNLMRLIFHANGLRRRVLNWEIAEAVLIRRLHREAEMSTDSPSALLLRELNHNRGSLPLGLVDPEPLVPTITIDVAVDGEALRLFNTLTTFGTPQDVTLDELRIDMSFPADRASEALLTRWAAPPS